VDTVAPFLILLGIAVLFWLVMIRPAQARQRATARMQSGIVVGDEVMLTSGIFGVVRALDEETMQIEVADDVRLKVVRAAVGRVVTPESRDEEETELAAPAADEPEEKQADGTQ
jgi:preprotein translocase subunit YajC